MFSPRFIAYIILFLLQWASISAPSRTSVYVTKPLLLLHTCTYETKNLLFISIASTMEARVEARREFEIYGVRHLM